MVIPACAPVHEDIAVGGKPGLDSFGNFPKNMLSEPLNDFRENYFWTIDSEWKNG